MENCRRELSKFFRALCCCWCAQVYRLIAQKSNQDEMANRLNTVKDRLDENKTNCLEVSCLLFLPLLFLLSAMC